MYTPLTSTDFAALSPLLIVLFGSLALLLLETFLEDFSKKFGSWVAFAFIAAALYASLHAPASQNSLLTPWLRFDSLSRVFNVIFLSIGLGTILLSDSFFKRFDATKGEYYFLLLSSLFGLILIAASADFLTLFLGIETLSISLYVLCAYMKKWTFSYESALKYFLMGSLAAAFLLYGIAFVYGAIGTTQLNALAQGYQDLIGSSEKALFLGGISLITLGLAFEAAIVPFQIWAPDVYEGAPTPVTAFMSVGTKAGALAAFVVVFMFALPHFHPSWNQAIAILAIPTLIYANFVAIKQTQIRRFFAYSGISHAGFLLIPIAVGTPDALSALLFYLIVYTIATLGAFACLAFLDDKSSGVHFSDLTGLYKRSPILASIFAVCLLTLAGIPPTAGFLAKFYLFKVAFEAGYYTLVVVALLTTILAAYYYLRIIALMFTGSPEPKPNQHQLWPATALAAIAFAGILLLSIYPTPLLELLK